MKADSSHIDNLIAKYIAGEASPAEAEQLMDWVESSPENKKYFGDIQFIHGKATAYHTIQKVDVDKAWQHLHAKMKGHSQSEAEPDKTIPLYKNYWFMIAASVVILMSLTIIFYKQLSITERPAIVQIISNDSIISKSIALHTEVVLNKNSKLSYSRVQGEKQIEIELDGEAYLDVVRPKDTSIVVLAGETFIRDIGTKFNVKAYPSDQTIEVYVESGQVIFYTNEQQGLTLNAGETGIYYKESKKFEKSVKENLNVVSYKTKLFVFNNSKLSDVINTLNAIYPQVISVSNTALLDCSITVKFDNEPLDVIVDIIAETLCLQAVPSNGGYMLVGDKCSSQ